MKAAWFEKAEGFIADNAEEILVAYALFILFGLLIFVILP
jgi:hypothetical protein